MVIGGSSQLGVAPKKKQAKGLRHQNHTLKIFVHEEGDRRKRNVDLLLLVSHVRIIKNTDYSWFSVVKWLAITSLEAHLNGGRR